MQKHWKIVSWSGYVTLLGVILTLIFANGLQIESNILKLLPQEQFDPTVDSAFSRFSDSRTKQVIFLIETPSKVEASAQVRELLKELNRSPYIESAISGISAEQENKMASFLFENRYKFLSAHDKTLIKNEDWDSFHQFSLQQLYSPINGQLVQIFPQDPLFSTLRFALSGSLINSNMQREEELTSVGLKGKKFYLVNAIISGSPFSNEVQKSLLKTIESIEMNWQKQSPEIKLHRTGAVFYAAYGFESAEKEVSTIGLGSLLGIIILLAWVFRSFAPFITILFTLSVGVTSGFILVHTLFGSVHLLTLIFGASLIGVAVDYAFHYLCTPLDDRHQRVNKIFGAISIGLVSSVIGYLSLFTAPFPGLKQMAVFCIAGLIAAYITVIWFLPYLPINSRVRPSVISYVERIVKKLSQPFKTRFWMAVLLIPVAGLGIFYIGINQVEDVRQFQSTNESLSKQQMQIQQILNVGESNQFYLVKGRTENETLLNLEKLDSELLTLTRQKAIAGYTSLSQYIPSEERLLENHQHLTKLFESGVLNTFASEGILEQSQIEDVKRYFIEQKKKSLNVESVLEQLDSQLLKSLWLGKLNSEYVALVSINKINQLSALKNLSDDIIFVDKVAKVSDVFVKYKKQAASLLLIAIVCVFLLLFFRKGLIKSTLIISSPIIAISLAIIGLVGMGYSINLFNTLALFLVLGVGVDYGVFLSERSKVESEVLIAVLMAASTTLLSFGLLALSNTPAIREFGVTMLIGILSAVVVAIMSQKVVRNENV